MSMPKPPPADSTPSTIHLPDPEYPVKTKHASGVIDGIATDVTVLSFTDKIMVTITQGGRLGQWIQVPLDPATPSSGPNYLPSSNPFSDDAQDDSLLPMVHLTPHMLLGAGGATRQTTGQLYAAQIASLIATKNSDEGRAVLVGLGLEREEASREQWVGLVELVGGCL